MCLSSPPTRSYSIPTEISNATIVSLCRFIRLVRRLATLASASTPILAPSLAFDRSHFRPYCHRRCSFNHLTCIVLPRRSPSFYILNPFKFLSNRCIRSTSRCIIPIFGPLHSVSGPSRRFRVPYAIIWVIYTQNFLIRYIQYIIFGLTSYRVKKARLSGFHFN